jgi:hypothetical protein
LEGFLTAIVKQEPAAGVIVARADSRKLACLDLGIRARSGKSAGREGRDEGKDGGGLEHHLDGFEGWCRLLSVVDDGRV